MRVLVVTGIWPPDVGGPATHAPEVARFLHERGHALEVVTTAPSPPSPEAFPVCWASRRTPKGILHARTAELVRRRARRADVVYTTGMFGRSAAGALAARRPYVVKLTADPAFERARRRGMVGGDVDAFQHGGGGLRAIVLRRARDLELRRAAHVFCPSAYLARLAVGWGVPEEHVSVLPNPAPAPARLRDREELRAELGFSGPTIAFAGRLTAQKSLASAVRAALAADGVALAIAGEGPDRSELERLAGELGAPERVRFLGPLPRGRVLELFRAADATILSSSWENFPHTVVEALAVGTPVLAMRAGGIGEVVEDGVNGLLVEPGDAAALAESVRSYFGDDELRRRLRERAAASVEAYAPERVFGELERVLEAVRGRT